MVVWSYRSMSCVEIAWHNQTLSKSTTYLNWVFLLDWWLSLPYCLLIAGSRIVGFISFQKNLAFAWEMKTTSFRIWTWKVMFNSYNEITTSSLRKLKVASLFFFFFIFITILISSWITESYLVIYSYQWL